MVTRVYQHLAKSVLWWFMKSTRRMVSYSCDFDLVSLGHWQLGCKELTELSLVQLNLGLNAIPMPAWANMSLRHSSLPFTKLKRAQALKLSLTWGWIWFDVADIRNQAMLKQACAFVTMHTSLIYTQAQICLEINLSWMYYVLNGCLWRQCGESGWKNCCIRWKKWLFSPVLCFYFSLPIDPILYLVLLPFYFFIIFFWSFKWMSYVLNKHLQHTIYWLSLIQAELSRIWLSWDHETIKLSSLLLSSNSSWLPSPSCPLTSLIICRSNCYVDVNNVVMWKYLSAVRHLLLSDSRFNLCPFFRQNWWEMLLQTISWMAEFNGAEHLLSKYEIAETTGVVSLLTVWKTLVQYGFPWNFIKYCLQGVRDAAVELLHILIAVHAEVLNALLLLFTTLFIAVLVEIMNECLLIEITYQYRVKYIV